MRKTHCDRVGCGAAIPTDEMEMSGWVSVTRYPLYRTLADGSETEAHCCGLQHLAEWAAENVLARQS